MRETLEHTRLYRRRLLIAAAAAVASPLGMPFISRGLAAGPIKIGFSGQVAAKIGASTEAAREGVMLALELAGGKAADQPVELLFAEASTPQEATEETKQFVAAKVAGLIGGSVLATARAVQDVANAAKVPLIIHSAMSDELTGSHCSRWSFRVPVPFGVHVRALLPYLTGYGKKWFLLEDGYPGGLALAADIKAQTGPAGAQIVGEYALAPGTDDFSAAFAKIKEAKPEVLIGAMQGIPLTKFLQAWTAAGMKEKIPFAQPGFSASDGYAAGPETATGIYTSNWRYTDPKNGRDDKAFTEAFIKKFNTVPTTNAWQGYISMRAMLAAITKTEGNTDGEKVRAGLEQFRSPNGDVVRAFRDFDHQMIYRVPILETKTHITDKYDWWDVEAHFPEKTSDLNELFGTKDQIGCKFPAA